MSADVKSLSFFLFSTPGFFTHIHIHSVHSFIMQKSHLGEQRYIYTPDTYRYRYRKRT